MAEELSAGTLADVKARTRTLWGRGDYGDVARRMQPAADALVVAARIGVGERVVDVAAGTGNVALAAGRHGAAVVATDLSPELVAQGKNRCRVAELTIEWQEADAEELPFDDGAFDAALSAFGVMYAPRPHVAASELFRVVTDDGVVGVANWATGSFQDIVERVLLSSLPEGRPSDPDVDWGDEDAVTALFLPYASTVEVAHGSMAWGFDSVDDWLERAERVAPPLVALRETLEEARFDELRWALHDAAEPFVVRTGGGVLLEQRYLIVVAHKR